MSNIVEGLGYRCRGRCYHRHHARYMAPAHLVLATKRAENLHPKPHRRPVKTILTANDKPHPKPGENPIPADCYRYVIFRKLQSDLDVAISSRATALKYHELSALREVMASIDLALTGLTLHDRKIMPLTIAESFYDGVRRLRWLGLPSDLRVESLTQPS